MHGNPWLRLLRREVEALVKKKHGDDYLKNHPSRQSSEFVWAERPYHASTTGAPKV